MGFTLHAPGTTLTFDAVLCDMDGLLVDSEGLSIAAWRAALAPYGVDLTDDDIAAMFGLRIDEDAAWIVAHYGLTATIEDLVHAKSTQMLALIHRTLQPMPGARDLVAWLVSHNVPRALATSGLEEYARVCLEAVGLAQSFSVWVTGDRVPHGKPAPDIFLLAAQRLGIVPGRCLVLEDAPHGVAAALAAGMMAIAIPNEHTAALTFPAPTLWASDLGQVLQWLDSA